ncbi:ras-related protein Rap-2b-like [Varroa destructor]|uniref:Uncharacterized protein n=1 Tax=Varroa destructor TaxID=109461 RepID=A0A7M7JA71_VARDE|nr:ras-related protein Rap-2b-like [Varroa destructor]
MREFKVVVLGSGGVGKSALTVQFVSGNFMEKYDPTIEDFYRKEIEVDQAPCVLEILDTAGTEQFASMRDLYIKNGQGFVVVYSITSHQTFQVRDKTITHYVGKSNKISTHKQKEVSAKFKSNVDEMFAEIVREMNVLPSKGKADGVCCCCVLM